MKSICCKDLVLNRGWQLSEMMCVELLASDVPVGEVQVLQLDKAEVYETSEILRLDEEVWTVMTKGYSYDKK